MKKSEYNSSWNHEKLLSKSYHMPHAIPYDHQNKTFMLYARITARQGNLTLIHLRQQPADIKPDIILHQIDEPGQARNLNASSLWGRAKDGDILCAIKFSATHKLKSIYGKMK